MKVSGDTEDTVQTRPPQVAQDPDPGVARLGWGLPSELLAVYKMRRPKGEVDARLDT